MIRNVELENYIIGKWDVFSQTDQKAMTWVWNQLMGETAKGDTLDFAIISHGDEQIYAGILRNKDRMIKGIIPAMYERSRDGFLETIDYKGFLRRDDRDNLDSKLEIKQVNASVDALAQEFFSSEKN